jgi:hypothetical protein
MVIRYRDLSEEFLRQIKESEDPMYVGLKEVIEEALRDSSRSPGNPPMCIRFDRSRNRLLYASESFYLRSRRDTIFNYHFVNEQVFRQAMGIDDFKLPPLLI